MLCLHRIIVRSCIAFLFGTSSLLDWLYPLHADRPRCKIGSDMRDVAIQNPSKHGPAASLAAFDLHLNARDIGCVDLTKAIHFLQILPLTSTNMVHNHKPCGE